MPDEEYVDQDNYKLDGTGICLKRKEYDIKHCQMCSNLQKSCAECVGVSFLTQSTNGFTCSPCTELGYYMKLG